MRSKRLMLMCVLALLAPRAPAVTTPDDEVAAYLRAHGMLSLLEIQLEDRIAGARDDTDRQRLSEQLSGLYLDQLRSFDADDPYRQVVLIRAQQLVDRMSGVPMYELRIELLIDAYLQVEPSVELSRLDLLEDRQRADAIGTLSEANHALDALSSKLDLHVNQLERINSRASGSMSDEDRQTLGELRRFRSLAHYYHAWTGYSLAVLRMQHVPADVLVSFGYLLGAKGETPQFSVFNESTLEFEHVARAAIGVALSHAQSGDAASARSWARFVVDSKYTHPGARRSAENRLLQILALEGSWSEALSYARELKSQRDDETYLPVADARFLALRSLSAIRSDRRARSDAEPVAKLAIERLVELGEIGHVLDLYQRFETLPLIADSFISYYAKGLAELARVEQSGREGMYATVSTLLASALSAKDAPLYPEQRDDCAIKLAYTEIRSNRPSEAIKVCRAIIERSGDDETIEEARWITIAAYDAINAGARRSTSDELDRAVREYILAYPATSKSARLILRHAMQGTIDPRVAIDTLASIDDDDEIAIPARRALVQLRYQQLREQGFADQDAIAGVLGTIAWIGEKQPGEITDLNDARSRIGTIRIGIDLALRAAPTRIDAAQRLLSLGMGILAYDPTLSVYRAEFVYRQIEIAASSGRIGDAMDTLGELETLDPERAQSAQIVLLNALLRRWSDKESLEEARLIGDIGSKVLARMIPPAPAPLSLQASSIAERIAESAAYVSDHGHDAAAQGLALRLSLLVLGRGQPTEQGLKRTAALANAAGDAPSELEAWLRLLAAYPSDSEQWYEARFESLRVMQLVDQDRARAAYEQFRLLHPSTDASLWSEKIAELFADPSPSPENQTPIGGRP